MPFSELKISQKIITALPDKIKAPTEIQRLSIPEMLKQHDLLAIAQTGSGKTLAYGLPLLALVNNKRPAIQSLILAPTRELAIQIQTSINDIASKIGVTSLCICGGVSKEDQIAQLIKLPNIVVATPGRLLDILSTHSEEFKTVRHLVLDEADRLLDMGFWPDIKKISEILPSTRHTSLFSATFSTELEDKTHQLLTHTQLIKIDPSQPQVVDIDETLYLINKGSKSSALIHIIEQSDWTQILIFIGAKDNADSLCKKLNKAGLSATALHGNKSQSERELILEQFRSKEKQILIATDLLARGIHVEKLPVVINYELPSQAEVYVHRIGRTARAGEQGSAISFVCHGEIEYLDSIRNLTQRPLSLLQLDKFPVTDKPSSHNPKRPPRDKQANRRTSKKKSIKQFQGKRTK